MCSWLNLFALRYKNGNQKKDMQYNGQEKFEDTKRANLEELHAIQCPKTKGQSEAYLEELHAIQRQNKSRNNERVVIFQSEFKCFSYYVSMVRDDMIFFDFFLILNK